MSAEKVAFNGKNVVKRIRELQAEEFMLTLPDSIFNVGNDGRHPKLSLVVAQLVFGDDPIPIVLRVVSEQLAFVVITEEEDKPEYEPYRLAIERIAEKLNKQWKPKDLDVDKVVNAFIERDKNKYEI